MPDFVNHSNPMLQRSVEVEINCFLCATSPGLLFEAIAPSPLILMLRPQSGSGQWVSREKYQVEPTLSCSGILG